MLPASLCYFSLPPPTPSCPPVCDLQTLILTPLVSSERERRRKGLLKKEKLHGRKLPSSHQDFPHKLNLESGYYKIAPSLAFHSFPLEPAATHNHITFSELLFALAMAPRRERRREKGEGGGRGGGGGGRDHFSPRVVVLRRSVEPTQVEKIQSCQKADYLKICMQDRFSIRFSKTVSTFKRYVHSSDSHLSGFDCTT